MSALAARPVSVRTNGKVVSRQEWTSARMALLAKEKELGRQRDELARQRQQLPWVRIDKEYTFQTPHGMRTLAELFGSKSQLVVYHFMFGPDWKEGCPGCSFVADHLNGAASHLGARDVSMVVVSRTTMDRIEEFKWRMGWRFLWFSSQGSDFNFDFAVSFSPEQLAKGTVEYNYAQRPAGGDELPGMSVFFKDADGTIYHTYSTYARGLETLLATYAILDMVPKGRDEQDLDRPMQWLRHHDKYDMDSTSTACCSRAAATDTPGKVAGSCCCDNSKEGGGR